MSDIFISYARSSEEQAKHVEQALRDAGYEVWRDAQLPAHQTYAEVIEEQLKSAKAVIVLWSAEAAKSQWVRAEADAARELGTLIQASVDATIPPMPFNQIQCADLSGWEGSLNHAGWQKLTGSVSTLAGILSDTSGPLERHGGCISICVLPFANMSGETEQEYFSDGISEDITTDLSKVSALAVTARNTAFTFKGPSVDVREVSRKLGVSHVLEGSVRKAGNRVRINAQLIDGATGDHIWADRYDRELTDIFAIQDEISKAIVEALKVKLLPAEKRAIESHGTTSADAYNLYLMARNYWITGNWGDVRQLELVIRLCNRAIEIDPHYAKAWGLLSIVRSILHFTFAKGDDDGLEAAERALALDPTVAGAYVVKARYHYEQGHFDEADRALEQALRLDPDSWEINREAGRIYYFQRRFPEAIRHYERSVEITENDYHSWGMLCSAYRAVGDEKGVGHAASMSAAQAERVVSGDPTNGAALGMGAYALAVLGERQRAKEWIDRSLLISPDNLFMRYNFACITASEMKDMEAAMELLEPTFDILTPSSLKAFEADPDLDGLRDHPRYQQGIKKAKARLRVGQKL